jgi:hypothetical protein
LSLAAKGPFPVATRLDANSAERQATDGTGAGNPIWRGL